jgi:hypothetical protein
MVWHGMIFGAPALECATPREGAKQIQFLFGYCQFLFGYRSVETVKLP